MPETFIPKIKKFFTWIFATICFIFVLYGSIEIVDLGLKAYVFTKADEQQCLWSKYPQPVYVPHGKTQPQVPDPEVELRRCTEERDAQKQRDASSALAFLLVGAPLFIFFYREAKKQ